MVEQENQNTDSSSSLDWARDVIRLEQQAIENIDRLLDDNFAHAVEGILDSKGRTIVCGMGKSGIIGKKIAATLASTGTASYFVHAGEAFHGDLGMISPEDVFIGISYSGETDELLRLIPFLKDNGNVVISISGNPTSTLASESDFPLIVTVPKEACPLELAPTCSTTATLVMGDALAVALMRARGFKPEQFARFHPGGSLGRRLLSSVGDQMLVDNLPTVGVDDDTMTVISSMTNGQMGIAVVLSDSEIVGIVTDGDLRRMLGNVGTEFMNLRAVDIMTASPVTVEPGMSMKDAIDLMERKTITRLLVAENNVLVGVLKK